MPTNPAIYPSAYSDLCPTTQTQEVDRVALLESQLLTIRAQLQIETRKSGRSAAELQNQTLQVTREVFPATTVGKHFIAGGTDWSTGTVNGQIDKLTHVSDSVSPIDFALTTARIRHAGISSFSNGYWCGGENDLAFTKITSVESIDFVTEKRRAVAVVLPATQAYARGVSSPSKGYVCGSFLHTNTPTMAIVPGVIRAMTFSSETFATLAANLGNVSGGCMEVSSDTAGYLAGGWAGVTTISKLTYSSETVSTLAAVLSYKRLAGSGNASQRRGYYCTGANTDVLTSTPTTIDALTFATDAIATLSATMARGDADVTGASSLRNGYQFNSDIPASTQVLNYATEQVTAIGAILSRGGRYAVPVGRP